jgi:hypothetical protein
MFLKQQTFTPNTSNEVLVFRSNISTPSEASALCTALYSVPGVRRCTLDFEDQDKLLRVQGNLPESRILVKIVKDWGVNIEELH